MISDADLLDDIERRVIENAPLAEILRMFLLLGGRLSSDKLRAWAKSELEGYNLDADVPAARTVGAPIYLNGIVGLNQITGQHISAAALPDFASKVLRDTITMRNSISEIESMIDNIKRKGVEVAAISIPNWAAIGRKMDDLQEFQNITAIYRQVHVTSLEAIVADARNRTAELLGEFRKDSKRGSQLPKGRKADAIVGVVVSGDGNSVVVATGKPKKLTSAVTSDSSDSKGWWGAWGRVGTIITVVFGALALVVWVVASLNGAPPPTP